MEDKDDKPVSWLLRLRARVLVLSGEFETLNAFVERDTISTYAEFDGKAGLWLVAGLERDISAVGEFECGAY